MKVFLLGFRPKNGIWDAHHEWKPSNGDDGVRFCKSQGKQKKRDHCLSIVMFKRSQAFGWRHPKLLRVHPFYQKLNLQRLIEHGQTKPTQKVCPANEFFVGASISFSGGWTKVGFVVRFLFCLVIFRDSTRVLSYAESAFFEGRTRPSKSWRGDVHDNGWETLYTLLFCYPLVN